MCSSVILNGKWLAGEGREYSKNVNVPGIFSEPTSMNDTSVWFKKELTLPNGDWKYATLVLNGARFCPSIYINGELVSYSDGGMTVTYHLLISKFVQPGKKIILEIELKSLRDVGTNDASRIPDADIGRTNISSCLWDKVELKLHGNYKITRLLPQAKIKEDKLEIFWNIFNINSSNEKLDICIEILNKDGDIVIKHNFLNVELQERRELLLYEKCKLWSPENPNCYKLKVTLLSEGKELDIEEMTLGLKEFKVNGLKFQLNEMPISFRSGTVVWHRWVSDPESHKLAFDEQWFEKNIVERLKAHGANGLRFHLGMPPEAFLDLCDKQGLLVQVEWSFFHSMNASKESLIEQWRNWIDLCLKHPCVALIHPWNETGGDQLKLAIEALKIISKEYPPLVISHRDVIHLHKYWWSMFENVGLYYDAITQFTMPVMADEFGGNYLDGDCDAGSYPTIKDCFLRFLGRNHTKEDRLQLHTESNSKIGEYWRRLGAAGISPFCILGSREDGNHHFLGELRDANPKPVWKHLTALYSPLSCSLEIWDKNYEVGQLVEIPVYLFNDTEKDEQLSVDIKITNRIFFEKSNENNNPEIIMDKVNINETVGAYSTKIVKVKIKLPLKEGEWCVKGQLLNSPVMHPVISSWNIRTLGQVIPKRLKGKCVAVAEEEVELLEFLKNLDIETCNIKDSKADIVLISSKSFNKDVLSISDMEAKIEQGTSIVILNIGPLYLGQGYLSGGDLGPLQSVMHVNSPKIITKELCFGTKVNFKEVAEPESFIHPAIKNKILWDNLNKDALGMWNGLRGGLIVPACDMEISGLSQKAFCTQWISKGADGELIKGNSYFVYELEGFYVFSKEYDKKIEMELKSKVKFIYDDAPALQNSINPNAPIKFLDLAKLYKDSFKGKAEGLIPMASCGLNLGKIPVAMITFGEKKGKIILSQLIMDGRLAKGFGQKGLYGIREDLSAKQVVINMLTAVII